MLKLLKLAAAFPISLLIGVHGIKLERAAPKQRCPGRPQQLAFSREGGMKCNLLGNWTQKWNWKYSYNDLESVGPSLPRCSMSTCFNFVRCRGKELTIGFADAPGARDVATAMGVPFQHPNNDTCVTILSYSPNVSESSVLTSDFNEQIQKWRREFEGHNLIVWYKEDPSALQIPTDKGLAELARKIGMPTMADLGNIMLAWTNMPATIFRHGFDFTLPLYPHETNPHDTIDLSAPRKYFLSFKGQAPAWSFGSERWLLLPHSDPWRHCFTGQLPDVPNQITNPNVSTVLLPMCQEGHCHFGQKFCDKELCAELDAQANRYEYHDLLANSTFCLVPAGRQGNTYRLLESMSYGCIPVIWGQEDWVLPYAEIVPWHEVAFVFHYCELQDIVPSLLKVSEADKQRMAARAIEVFHSYFSKDRLYSGAVQLLQQRLFSHRPGFGL